MLVAVHSGQSSPEGRSVDDLGGAIGEDHVGHGVGNKVSNAYPVSASLGALRGEIGIFKPVVHIINGRGVGIDCVGGNGFIATVHI